jgi:uncharacterized protein YbbC (DUF1343 family)
MRTGLDRLLGHEPRSYGRTGWLVNGSAVTSAGFAWGPVAATASGFTVTQLFAPEHGAHGAVAAGVPVGDHRDSWTGLPVCSLYGAGQRHVGNALGRCDTVVIDLPDNGTRYSTYLATSAGLLDAVAAHPSPPRVVVADRPNLLGRRREGPPLLPGFESIVGRVHVPARHGLTLGEALRAYVRETGIRVDLEVVTAEGWDPHRMIEHGPYLPPSPNLTSFTAQLLYAGTCLIEGTNVSEGRGTAAPFQMAGAPWLDGPALAAALRADGWPGVLVREVTFIPAASKHQGQPCNGVFLHVSDAGQVRPVELAVRLLELIFTQSDRTELRSADDGTGPPRFLDRLWGSAGLADHLASRRTGHFTVAAAEIAGLDAIALYPY